MPSLVAEVFVQQAEGLRRSDSEVVARAVVLLRAKRDALARLGMEVIREGCELLPLHATREPELGSTLPEPLSGQFAAAGIVVAASKLFREVFDGSGGTCALLDAQHQVGALTG